MLMSCCAAVKRMVTGCGGKLKALVAKQKLFKLDRKGEIFFQADRKRGLSFSALEGKIEHWIRISARKRPCGSRL